MEENAKTYFFWNEPYFEEAVRRVVCPYCPRHAADGACLGNDPRGCALFRYLPQLVILAQRLEESAPELYLRAVRENVSMECANPDPGAPCPYHDTLHCGLEPLLPRVLEAVREEDMILEKRSGY